METTHPRQGDSPAETIHPVDQIRPVGRLFLFAIQHILVMVAAPVSSVFLIAKSFLFSAAARLFTCNPPGNSPSA